MTASPTPWVACIAFLSLAVLFFSARDLGDTLSPQGCRMSWMSPSYVQQTNFNVSWSPLASRYSLWLYREVGWDAARIGDSLPVLFVPGNAGSSQQVRSIASSATLQYFSSPLRTSPEFSTRSNVYKPLDFYAVEFNEDLSAFHGTTLESQIDYTSKAVAYILSLYPPNTRIIVLGHSMGGVVATSLLPSPQISAVITMSTPFTLPPARFDNNIDSIYANIARALENDPTPIVSLCGGATDMMIPSESCILPPNSRALFRRTVFSSALEGAWTGVGHREMVWCHQVRWRIARAALELAPFASEDKRVEVLDRWLRDGHTLPSLNMEEVNPLGKEADNASVLPAGRRLVVDPPMGTHTYILPIPTAQKRFTVLTFRGTVLSVAPEHSLPFNVSVYQCSGQSDCSPFQPDILKLIPTPVPNKPFPVPNEGSDESEGVVLLEALLDSLPRETTHLAVKIQEGDGRGWVIADFSDDDEKNEVYEPVPTTSLLFGGSTVSIPSQRSLHSIVRLPNLLSNVLVVYRLTALGNGTPRCVGARFPPLLAHTSHPDETHYFPLTDHSNRILLHTHLPAPFVTTSKSDAKGLVLDVFSSGISECTNVVDGIKVSIDWSATFGRWATRYWTSAIVWSVGVTSLIIFYSWDSNGHLPPVSTSLQRYGNWLVRRLLVASFLFSFVPLPKGFYLGNAGEPLLAIIAPSILVISSGLVIGVWWTLRVLILITSRVNGLFFGRNDGRRAEISSVTRNTVISMGLLFLVIFLFVPWQVAYLGCWALQLYTCAVTSSERSDEPNAADGRSLRSPSNNRENNANLNHHVLLLMTWLLPLVAPILAVWVRTLATAGLPTPFNGDHNFLMVAPFLVLVDFASWTQSGIFAKASFENIFSARWLFAIAAGVAFLIGSRNTYVVFHAIAIVVGVLVCTKVGRRYWTGSPSNT